jgi:SpoVK/Ycf46/Vps4 family AAA+-type ATPase
MGRLVTHIPSRAAFDSLIVPASLRETLADIVGFYRAAPRVRAEMGLSGASPLGRGLSCLFSGSPGTGKTFAAQCLASALGLNLYRIDLSQVVSKYIGETEKALSRVFEEAEAGHGILLFDEADALFGKRSEVKDAHDRYANVEVAYLLQRMESFEGISILTTNLRSNMDTAFLRRLRFVLEFPMPDASMRMQLWQRSLPTTARWASGLDLQPFVERFTLAGGSIYNIGIAAAHLAATEPDGLLRVEHLVRATYRELEKVGLGRSREDFGPLAVHLPAHVQQVNGKPAVWARGRA